VAYDYDRLMSNYIDNKKFEELIQEFKSEDRTREDELFKMFDTLVERLMLSFKFNVDREEAKQECFLLILKVLKNFNRESGQAFNYFTTVILNNLRLLYSKNKKYNEKLESYRNHKMGYPKDPSSV
jgi:DNA-directed RNA polymerase specialized sigma24 family protein